ncbi:alpha/beta hydrolase [Plectonema radiosum NIES-515]|uniref:Alpha/beta hydrolase n=1 Tax=Plectonema radiosum NIES-515 TaxID=2986073 RepID=A0ABT3B5C0_9CYAN|nr:alpha/beta hydrolase [Plectonema radiosum]MCV3216577.1 alpha/beta hydrolase [Plectonema radiosum NIES-515]
MLTKSSEIPSEQIVNVQKIRTYFRVVGPEEGQPVVLLHGFLSSSYTWRNVWGALAKNYRVYIPDLPGYGKSPSGHPPYSVDSYAQFLNEFLKTIGVQKATIVGAQMGGSIAAWFASQYPDMVKDLIIMAAGAMGETKTNMWLYKLIATPILGSLAARFFPLNLFSQRWRAAHVNKEVATDDVILYYFRNFQRTGYLQTRIGLQVRASYGSQFERFEGVMKYVEMPTLLIWGEDDPLVPLSTAYRFKNFIKNSQLVTISHCGDFPHEEYPDIVASHILEFISR